MTSVIYMFFAVSYRGRGSRGGSFSSRGGPQSRGGPNGRGGSSRIGPLMKAGRFDSGFDRAPSNGYHRDTFSRESSRDYGNRSVLVC